ncbi:hypothetical protein ACFFV8_16535 [Sphingobium indicum]|nr:MULTISPECIES: hypothetical protein [Sphingobium]
MPPPDAFHQFRERLQAQEQVRQTQQGRGKPIISANVNGHQLVAVGNRLHSSRTWKTFVDFLSDYLKMKLTPEWGNAEIKKPLNERHTIMQWYDALCHVQATTIKQPGEPTSIEVNGVLACYFGLAYALYLLEHNIELQDRMIARLRDQGNFQGAYYELVVARALIGAGFDLVLEDETDKSTKHCEFAAISKDTGQKFWIEAKMRSVSGLFGKTDKDGVSTKAGIATSQLISHLNGALKKPAANQRMIFIDLNAEMNPDASDDNRPAFVKAVNSRLATYEQKDLEPGQSAYVFVTNMTFHRDLLGPAQMIAIPTSVGIPDFNRPGFHKLSDFYRSEKKHADALRVAESIAHTLRFPTTFDGSMPATTLLGERPPLTIGERYSFEGAGPDGNHITGTVTDVTVMETWKAAMIAVSTDDGRHMLLRENLSDAQLTDFKNHPDAYNGKVKRVSKGAKTPYDLFKFFVEAFANLTRKTLLERLKLADRAASHLSDEDLLLDYCERLVAGSGMFESQDGVLQPKASAENSA